MKRFSLLFAAAVLLFAACSDQPSSPVSEGDQALGKAAPDASDEVIDLKDRYIVVFKSTVGNVDELVDQMTRGNGSKVHYRYQHALKGFAATIPPQAVEGLRRNPNVAYIEPDIMMHAIGTQDLSSYGYGLWGLDRIDQRTGGTSLDHSYTYGNDGSGVTVYILDTGIQYNHVEFGTPTRAILGWDAWGGSGADLNGHGTHVAGTVGGEYVGVAKGVTLVSVRVLDRRGNGTASGVIGGINWVMAQNTALKIANMSLGGGFYQPINDAVHNAVQGWNGTQTFIKTTFVVAAGNETANVSTKSPASEPLAITVGATDMNDNFAAWYSNFGSGVDILAPGSAVYSSVYNRSANNVYDTYTGTSMATPHVSGVAALCLKANPTYQPLDIDAQLKSDATNGIIANVPSGTTQKLLYCGLIGGGTTTPTAPAPSAVTAALANGDITVMWTGASGVDGYDIQYSTNGGSSWSSTVSLSSSTTSYIHSGVTPGVTYLYHVRSTQSGANPSAWVESNSVSVPSGPSTTVYVSQTGQSKAWVNPSNWVATMTITLDPPVVGATVTVTWTGGASGSATGITDASGFVSISTNPLNGKKVSYVDMHVADVTATGYTFGGYGPSASDQHIIKP